MKSLEQLMRKCQQWLLAVDLQLVCMTSSLARVLAELGIGCKPLHEGQDVQRMHWHLSRQLSVAVDAEVGRAISVRGCTMPCSSNILHEYDCCAGAHTPHEIERVYTAGINAKSSLESYWQRAQPEIQILVATLIDNPMSNKDQEAKISSHGLSSHTRSLCPHCCQPIPAIGFSDIPPPAS